MTSQQKNRDRNRRRAFGQNFLVDEGVLAEIAADIGCTGKDRIVEIGPGNGALTRHLLGYCSRITAVEIDHVRVEHLRKTKEFSSVKIIHADAGAMAIEELTAGTEGKRSKPILVGNLPYNRAGPLLRYFIPAIGSFKFMYIMVQYEVAKRMISPCHQRDFGTLSVFVQNYTMPELRQKIPPQAFRPRPKVWSATVKLRPLNRPRVDDPAFLPFVNRAFTQKRKTLANSLRQVCDKTSVLACLDSLGIPAACRPEDLTVEQFGLVYARLKDKLSY